MFKPSNTATVRDRYYVNLPEELYSDRNSRCNDAVDMAKLQAKPFDGDEDWDASVVDSRTVKVIRTRWVVTR